MVWNLYLPIARHSVDVILLLGLGGAVGFISGLFGVGGGFLMTPFLIAIGIHPTVAAASDSNQIIAAAASGTFAHYRMGNVDMRMGILILIGNWVGGTLGVEIIKMLRALGEADFLIKMTYVVLLGVVGSYMLFETLQRLRKKPAEVKPTGEPAKTPLYVRLERALPWHMHFEKSGVTISPLDGTRSVGRASFRVPAGIPTGTYRVCLTVIQDGQAVDRRCVPFKVVMVGLPAFLVLLASRHEVFYGLLCISVAAAGGFLSGVFFSPRRSRKSRGGNPR